MPGKCRFKEATVSFRFGLSVESRVVKQDVKFARKILTSRTWEKRP